MPFQNDAGSAYRRAVNQRAGELRNTTTRKRNSQIDFERCFPRLIETAPMAVLHSARLDSFSPNYRWHTIRNPSNRNGCDTAPKRHIATNSLRRYSANGEVPLVLNDGFSAIVEILSELRQFNTE